MATFMAKGSFVTICHDGLKTRRKKWRREGKAGRLGRSFDGKAFKFKELIGNSFVL
jgi:hypothetical protein